MKEQLFEWLVNGTLAEELLKNKMVLTTIIDKETGDSLFHWLCQNASIALISQFLEQYPHLVDIKNKLRETPLMQAISSGKQAITHLLISHHANRNLKNNSGTSAHMIANAIGCKISLSGINFKRIFEFEEKYLQTISPEEQMALFDEIRREFNLLTPIDECDNTFLHFFVQNSSLIALNHVLNNIPRNDLNCQNIFGATPLMSVASSNRQTIVHLLMNFQPNLTLRDNTGNTAKKISTAASPPIKLEPKGFSHILLVAEKLSQNNLEECYLEVIEELKKDNDGLLAPIDEYGNSILHFAVSYASLKVIAHLLGLLTADQLNSKNDINKTPLDVAKQSGKILVVRILIAYGAKPSEDNDVRFTVKRIEDYFAIDELLAKLSPEFGIEQILEEVSKLGFGLEEPIDANDNTMMNFLINNAPLHIIKKVFAQNPTLNINIINASGQNYLMLAILAKRQNLVDFLISHGADTTIEDNYGKSTIDYANESNIDISMKTRHPTIHEQLVTIGQAAQLHFHLKKIVSTEKKLQFLFHKFIHFVKTQKWRYDPALMDYGNHPFIFDANIHTAYTVNCFDMSKCFKEIVAAAGIADAKLFIYKDVKSKPFLSKDENIFGDFVCFDEEYHQKILAKNGHYDFAKHCVVKVHGIYFDPTMRCFYNRSNHVVAKLSKDKNTPKPIIINAYYNQEEEHCDAFNSLCLLLPLLKEHFEHLGWDVILQRKHITITDKKNEQTIIVQLSNTHAIFEFIHPEPRVISQFVMFWQQVAAPLTFGYDLFLDKESAGVILLTDLMQNEFDINALRELFVDDDQNEKSIAVKDRVLEKISREPVSLPTENKTTAILPYLELTKESACPKRDNRTKKEKAKFYHDEHEFSLPPAKRSVFHRTLME